MRTAHFHITPAQHIAAAITAATVAAGITLAVRPGRRHDGLFLITLAGFVGLGCIATAEAAELRRRVRSVQAGNGNLNAQIRQINDEMRQTRESVQAITRVLRAIVPPVPASGRHLGVIRNN